MEWLLIIIVVVLWAKLRGARRAAERSTAADAPGTEPHVIEGIVMATTGGFAYWHAGGRLVRAPWVDGYADLDALEPADPLECDDLPPALALEIIEALEQAETRLRGERMERS